MYATCLYCTHDLGRNEVLERFPVGARLAFDAVTGRLWVVCPRCARWNLSPLEERWEAIETCERRFRDTRLRVSTDNVGLARLPEGLELVRIGRPQRPEIAAWRYGSQFLRRRRSAMLVAGGRVAVTGAVWAALTGGLGAIGLMHLFDPDSFRRVATGDPERIVARLPTPDGEILRVRRRHLALTGFEPSGDGGPVLAVRHINNHRTGDVEEVTRFAGAEALRTAGRLFPAVNQFGGTPDDVRLAVARIEHAGSAERYFAALARTGVRASRIGPTRSRWYEGGEEAEGDSGLLAMPVSARLAIEMVAHEEQERRALEGELAALEQEWRLADALARIADDLVLPQAVRDGLERLRGH